MKRRIASVLPKFALAPVLLCAGCASLVYERAVVDEGFGIAVAANTEYRSFVGGTEDLGGLGGIGFAPGVSLDMRNGFNEHFGIFGHLGANYAPKLDPVPEGGFVIPFSADVWVGTKIAPFAPEYGSLRIVAGVPDYLQATYLLTSAST